MLVDMIDLSIDGHREAKQQMATDPHIGSAELLAEVSNDTDNVIDTLKGIREKVTSGG